MNYNHMSNASTHISLIREQHSNSFKIGIKIKAPSSNAVKQHIVDALLDSMNSSIKSQPRRDIPNPNMKETLETKSDSNVEITSRKL